MEKKNKHIVIITPGFPLNETESNFVTSIQLFTQEFHNNTPYKVSIISYRYPFDKGIYFWNDIPVYTFKKPRSILLRPVKWWAIFRTLLLIHRNHPIEVIQSFWLSQSAALGYWFAKYYKIKHFTTLLGQDVLQTNKFAYLLPLSKMNLISVSNNQQKLMFQNFKITPRLIPLGITENPFINQFDKTIDIIGLGSFIPLKNFELFIEVIFEINKIRPLKVVLLGDGVLRKRLEQKTEKLHLEAVIEFLGCLTYKETLCKLAQSKILLHPSQYEGFGMVFPEALQAKSMIVSQDVGCALASNNWKIANTKTQMAEACLSLLDQNFDDSQPKPLQISEMVQLYLNLYSNENI